MIFTQHYLQCLSQASYLIGDKTTGRAVVVDPRRDVGIYLEEAEENGLRIERVIETHIHADFLSGHLELAEATGAVISYGEQAGVEFAIEPLRDGQRLSLGEVTFEILSTPGHTPESICIVVYEHPGDGVPYGVLTGDTLFVGDVGRPDLCSSSGISAKELAAQLYESLHDKLLTLPDATRVFPAHGAGSSCGKNLSSDTSSTIGEQRKNNYALTKSDVHSFIAAVTEGQSVQPPYFKFDSKRNAEAHPLLDEEAPPLLGVDAVLQRAEDGAVLLDTRDPGDHAAGHLRGAVNISLHGRFAEWAGNVLSPERDIVLVGDPAHARESKIRLARVGFDRVIGQLRDLAEVVTRRQDLVESASRLSVHQLAGLRDIEHRLQVVDVRGPGEVEEGIIPGARLIPLPTLTASLSEIDQTAPVALYCASGVRSMVAASVLRASGFHDVSDVLGGYGAWKDAEMPVAGDDEVDSIADTG
ncbi:MBL fold metallo-hydrolase [Mycobacterium sp. 94-17]|uniref:MBL fold metallo-hydrolase n=1 Tax=Mycobacterium sp. 94-17 TaxID=2986147 RepID=UPI002D1E6314|nr:MBL fold metallo-hydrolase [Mycobacterium sp. 94-17]MEB4209465.1 MBL fold metallo-hydrolase [Mycobacterium sp. 94-17]